jgi:uncharacterized protein
MHNFLDPAILFFVFGVFAGLVRSNLQIPAALSRFLSLYLLMALGLKGGFALARSGLNAEVLTTLGCAVALAVIVPLLGYQIMRRFLDGFDAAAIAATYGSVSAVTFITTLQYLESRGQVYGGHMAAAMALMESPAIILAVLLANRLRQQAAPATSGVVVGAGNGTLALAAGPAPVPLGKLLHESFTDGAQLLLLGAMLIGLLTGAQGEAVLAPFSVDLFKGMLSFFLLDMGLTAARQLTQLGRPSPFLLLYAIGGPLLHASLALGLAWLLGIAPGNGTLLMVLAASASYIAVPAALRFAIPEARPALYIGLSLGVTFPFNILLGIPLYESVARSVLA